MLVEIEGDKVVSEWMVGYSCADETIEVGKTEDPRNYLGVQIMM